jgi:hypothetical protein
MRFLNGVYLLLVGFPSNNSLVHYSFIETELRSKNDSTMQTSESSSVFFYTANIFKKAISGNPPPQFPAVRAIALATAGR